MRNGTVGVGVGFSQSNGDPVLRPEQFFPLGEQETRFVARGTCFGYKNGVF